MYCGFPCYVDPKSFLLDGFTHESMSVGSPILTPQTPHLTTHKVDLTGLQSSSPVFRWIKDLEQRIGIVDVACLWHVAPAKTVLVAAPS